MSLNIMNLWMNAFVTDRKNTFAVSHLFDCNIFIIPNTFEL